MTTLMIVDKTPSVHRLKEIAYKLGIQVVETYSSTQTLARLKAMPGEIDMVLIDVLLDREDGFQLIADIKQESPLLPVVILTALNSRRDFIRGLKVGANDYILKPFEDRLVEERILKLASRAADDRRIADTIDFKRYLELEIVKSKKGNYPLTVCMMIFGHPGDMSAHKVQTEYDRTTESVFNELRSVFFDTDICVPYGPHTILAVLPFCPKDKITEIKDRVQSKGAQVLSQLNLPDYKMLSSFVTVPEDGEDLDILMNRLYHDLTEHIKVETKGKEPKSDSDSGSFRIRHLKT